MMETKNKKSLYASLLARDPRNDGRFYFGVTTTGIYCRPICPAKPKLKNVEFYRSKAEAEGAGFRPCLRCRPDVSPLSPRWQGTAAILNRALKILEQIDQDGGDIQDVAVRLGMSDRHLRRLFDQHLGASPIEIAISQRLHLARQLLSETRLSVLDVAMASGFGSQRRFYDAFRKAYQRAPGEFRKEDDGGPLGSELKIELPYVKPYDWDFLLAYFQRHEARAIERVVDNTYMRQFQSPRGLGFYRVSNLAERSALLVKLSLPSLADLRFVVERIKAQFDLLHNPFHIAFEVPEESSELSATLEEVRAVRIPGAFDPFEAAISIILAQLVSMERARELLNTIVERYGTPVASPLQPGFTHIFPSPKQLRDADFEGIGLTRVRGEAIRALAQVVDDGQIDLSSAVDLDHTRSELLALKGIGPWTVEAIAMRCLADPDAYPAKDLIVARAIEKFALGSDFLRPWRAYLALAIWKTQAQLLSKKGRKKS